MALKADVLLEGEGKGEVLALTHPISFWGGVDPRTGLIIDARHPERGQSIAGKILAMPAMIGSSSAAAVMLELIHSGRSPTALIMPAPDAILLLGVIVARKWAGRCRRPTPFRPLISARYMASRCRLGRMGRLRLAVEASVQAKKFHFRHCERQRSKPADLY